uniref:Uncharacterized protein n=1 Tax=Lactuca sativa TaxID=4236 RepID=A0A9R1VTP3_LACSA|nr:hypothetical protein LSAT_V11C400220090 [Lactuca sativa]
MIYGPEEFCLITRFNFGLYAKMIRKKVSKKVSSSKRCLLREHLVPNQTSSSVKISDLKSFILNQPFLAATDDDIEFTYDDLEDMWNEINKYLSLPEPCQSFKYSVSGFTTPFREQRYTSDEALECIKKLKWVDAKKIFYVTKEGRRPRHRMAPSDEDIKYSFYMSCQEYVYSEPPSVPPPLTISARVGQSENSSLEDLANPLIALEQLVYLNRQRTEVNMEEVNEENLWNNINFDELEKFQTN